MGTFQRHREVFLTASVCLTEAFTTTVTAMLLLVIVNKFMVITSAKITLIFLPFGKQPEKSPLKSELYIIYSYDF